jgi:SAM-dependent methyltransferase
MLNYLPLRTKLALKRLMLPLVYRYPPFRIAPERLYVWLDVLEATRSLPGPVIEVGCDLGGTAIIAHRMLRRTGAAKPYVCVDTFGGFVPAQFDRDVELGTPASYRRHFSGNSIDLVRRILRRHDATGVELVQADISRYGGLPENISAALLDVDLSEPTYEGLKRLYARLAPGGIICIDDCPRDYDWKARIGYRQFVAEAGLPEIYRHGMGVVVKQAGAVPAVLSAA